MIYCVVWVQQTLLFEQKEEFFPVLDIRPRFLFFLLRTKIFSVFLSELEIQPDGAYEKQYVIVIKFTLMEFIPVKLRASSATQGPITEQYKPRRVYTINT
jgi:hypothetical protein